MSHYDFADDLAKLDETYAECEPAEKKEFEDIPAGRYQACIDRLYLDRAKSSGRLLLKWELVVAVGPYKERRIFRNNTLETPDNMRWLKTDLQTAGLVLGALSELPAQLEGLIGVMLDVTVSVKGSGDQARTNVYLNKRVDREAPSTSPAAGTATQGVSRGLSRF